MTHSTIEPIPLDTWPTPLEPAPRLSAAIGLEPGDLWVKRDDLTGLGGGGNKVRKLEWTMATARADGADVVLTSGAAQSNHARLTAAAGARLGIDVVLVLGGAAPAAASGNVALDRLLGAEVVWAGAVDEAGLAGRLSAEADARAAAGRRPALIPYGGSTPLSTTGYVTCANEILAQGPRPDHVVTALGSGGTMAGLVRGLGADRVLGVHCGAVEDPETAVRDLLRPVDEEASLARLRIAMDGVGRGYAQLGPGVPEACELTARHAGIVLDPVYTGRAMAGLVRAVARGEIRPGQRTVFLHSGGMPGLFGHQEMLALLS